MPLRADLTAWLIQKSAPLTVRYGRDLTVAGADLAAPSRLDVPTRHGRVRCHVYRPALGSAACPPVYVHLHGGAFVMRHPQMDDFLARYVASACDAVVVNVDYAVAPQVRYPVAQEQAHDVAAWVAAHGPSLDADGRRVAIGGFSAGGNLAASAALQARDLASFRPVLQVLGARARRRRGRPHQDLAAAGPDGQPGACCGWCGRRTSGTRPGARSRTPLPCWPRT